jgi:hypothetical protein
MLLSAARTQGKTDNNTDHIEDMNKTGTTAARKIRIAVPVCLVAALLVLLTLLDGCGRRRYEGPYVEVNGDFGGVDDLGRVLPLSGDVSAARDRKVGIFYFLWQGEHGTSGPYDNYKIVLEHPEAIESEENWFAAGGGNRGAHHFWGEPLFGYYVSSDTWVLSRHAQMLTDAGVDFIVFDTTNGPLYLDRVKQLIDVWYGYYLQGYDVPKLAFLTNNNSSDSVNSLYYALYANEYMHKIYPRLDELWYYWDGKPMIVASETVFVPLEIEDYFTVKDTVWPTSGRTDNGFPWMEFSRLYTDDAVYGRGGRKEVVNVSTAQHNVTINMSCAAWYGGGDHTRSYHDGAVDRSPDAILYGYNLAEQWEWAIGVDPEMVFVTGWNEWVAQRQPATADRPVNFVDCANPEASRDIEPMNGLLWDNYYMELIKYVRIYKGSHGRVATGGNITIDLDGGFDQWADGRITAVYTDYEGDVFDRDHTGFGGILYTDDTGRNDFVGFKVCRDKKYVYFYAETAGDITPSTDDNWMTLFIASGAWRDSEDQDRFWFSGIDFAVNLEKPEGNTVFVSKYSDGGWIRAGEGEMRVSGNKMMIRISKKLLGVEQGAGIIDLQFKWADNYQYDEDGTLDVWTFYRNGDSAPFGRLTYVFSERQ